MADQVWEIKTKERIKSFLRSNLKLLEKLKDRDAVEADTRTFVMAVLVEALGYDIYEELTAEYMVRGEFADIGIRINKKLEAFVEIKRISTELREIHLRQVKTYCANEGVEWAILTNGRRWQVYHISNKTPIEEVLLIDIDLLADNTTRERLDALMPLSRESLGRDVLTTHWNSVKSLNAENLWKAINTPRVLAAIRAELRKDTDQLVDANKLASAIQMLKL